MSRSRACPPATSHGRPSTIVLVLACLGAFMAFLDATIVNIAFPDIRRAFAAADLSELSWVLNAYNVAFAALLVPAGRYAELIGIRRAFSYGVAIFTLASLGAGLAPSLAALIAMRVVQAVGAALIVPSSLTLLLRACSMRRRSTAVGLWGAAAAVAAAIGPSLGGAVVYAADWRWVFIINLPIGLITLRLAGSLPDQRSERAMRPDALGTALVATAVGLLALAIVQGEAWGWQSAAVIGSFLASALSTWAFIWRTRGRANPAVDLALFRRVRFRIANLCTAICAMAFYAMLFANALFLTEVWGYSVWWAGLALTPAPLLAAAVAGPAGRVADTRGHRIVIAVGGTIYTAAGILLLVRVGTSPAYLSAFLPATVLIGIGLGMAFPTLSAAAVSDLSDKSFAAGSAINAAARQVGAVVGIAVVATVVGTAGRTSSLAGFRVVWAFTSAAAALAAAVILLCWPRP
ncbi:MAG TPA: DHA2 family efflux MFS transporter permease subunit [Solirubrobacteraceae bacterium]|nr:DHA2 family efflux MFS transporter permease subunit [Solirubrobacteraceae bacterium]